jgi:hypothetical protein
MIVYCNNSNRREHERIFGSGAFYDLATVGYQATKATNLSVGQQCIVATPDKDGKIVFSWYEFLREVVQQDDEGNSCRAFFGKRIKSDTLSKGDAARDVLYSAFFDKNGNFKRQSVIQR